MAGKKVIGGGKARKPQQKVAPRVDESLMEPGDYEVTPEHTFDILLFLKEKDGRWVVVNKGGSGVSEHKIVMRMWSYDEMVELRKRATSYDQNKRIHMIDQDLLNRIKIQKLMMSWTLSDDNARLKIHRRQGALTDESWTNVKRLQTNILQFIINSMNEVYELNG
jgi:hypothetical protein